MDDDMDFEPLNMDDLSAGLEMGDLGMPSVMGTMGKARPRTPAVRNFSDV